MKKSNLTLTLHSHATLELKNDNFCLLCDPWLIGSAFLGAWRNYPKPLIHPKDLKPNAIYISHEHSDHLHPATLNFFDKDTKIYIPSFSNMRMEKKLKELGFKNVNPLNFGQKMKIAGDIFITIYEPASIWNDSQSLIEISGYKILNVNDSGFNRRIAKQIGEIDILCSSFSPGASGYPLTWSHLNDERKVEIFTTQAIAQLEMLTQMAKEFKAKYFLPFASHFILNHPKHLPYMNLMRKNTIQDVINAFKNERCKVIDLLTGESFSLPNAEFKKLHYAQNLYDKSIIEKYIKEEFDEDEFISQYPTNKFDINKLKKYFLILIMSQK
ncbi:MBL fold metallo-hydrolase [Helicobacter equorum]|uniref:MBL fold metallo-hydrolase n=1 Tax=Helicobacter equorum TaxID=361872 RepID=UPI001F34ACE4|nr:MBL fold metallo-hydrolase [Helicobacter equorum]